MLTIKCAGCQSKIFKYQKVGKGRVLCCWDTRIVKDYSYSENDQVKCVCGEVIGTKNYKWSQDEAKCLHFQRNKDKEISLFMICYLLPEADGINRVEA